MYNDNDNTSGEEDGPATFFCYEKAAELYDDAFCFCFTVAATRCAEEPEKQTRNFFCNFIIFKWQ